MLSFLVAVVSQQVIFCVGLYCVRCAC